MSDLSDEGQKVETEIVQSTNKAECSITSGKDDQEYYDSSFDIFNVDRISMTNQSLHQVDINRDVNHRDHHHYLQVEQLLLQLQECERLYPSTRQLVSTNTAWGDTEFQNRSNKFDINIFFVKSKFDFVVFIKR